MIQTYELLAHWLRARFAHDERGASLVEYALLVALIAVVCIAAVTLLASGHPLPSIAIGHAEQAPAVRADDLLPILDDLDLLVDVRGTGGLIANSVFHGQHIL